MQQCQDQLQFQIETPNDQELARRFADRQKGMPQHRKPRAKSGHKPRNRKSKHTKKMERLNRDKSTNI